MSQNKLIAYVCITALILICGVIADDFYSKNFLAPQNGYYIISEIHTGEFKTDYEIRLERRPFEKFIYSVEKQLSLADPILYTLIPGKNDGIPQLHNADKKDSANLRKNFFFFDGENKQIHLFHRNIETIVPIEDGRAQNKDLPFPEKECRFQRETERSFTLFYTFWSPSGRIGCNKEVLFIKVDKNDPRLLALQNLQHQEHAEDLAYYASLQEKLLPMVVGSSKMPQITAGSIALNAPAGSELIRYASHPTQRFEQDLVPTYDSDWYLLRARNFDLGNIHTFSTRDHVFDFNTITTKMIPDELILFQDQHGIIYFDRTTKKVVAIYHVYNTSSKKHILAETRLPIKNITWKVLQQIYACFLTLDSNHTPQPHKVR